MPQQRMPYRLNPYEEQTLQALAAGIGAGMDPMQAYGIYDQTMSGAIDRRQANLDMRQQGLMQLRDVATSLASSGADPESVTTAVMGQAAGLPLMRNKRGVNRLAGLSGFVEGLYPEGSDISGLAPPEMREMFGDQQGIIDDEDKAVIGTTVAEALSKGLPFVDIREAIRRQLVGVGYDEQMIDEGIRTAESMYEEMTGVGLGEMREGASSLRELLASGGSLTDLGEQPWLEQYQSQLEQNEDPGAGVQGLLGQLAGDRSRFGSLLDLAQGYSPDEGGGDSLLDRIGVSFRWPSDISGTLGRLGIYG